MTIWSSESEFNIVAKLYPSSYNNDLGTQIYVLDETYVLCAFPTGHHADSTVPFGAGFSEAMFAFSLQIIWSSASSTRVTLSFVFLEASTRLTSSITLRLNRIICLQLLYYMDAGVNSKRS